MLEQWMISEDEAKRRHAAFRLEQPDAQLEYPSIFHQVMNAAHALGSVAASAVRGEPVSVPREEQARRLAICHACAEWYDPIQDRCRHGGCGCFLALKTRIATQHCPLDPPKW